jgi:multiple sugar transport system ATP-binding protein
VQLDRVRKVYDNGHVAVSEARFRVADGELLVLVGPSGCGKSTVLRMIAGLESISDGALTIDGRLVNDVAPKDRDIAIVFQNYAPYPHMSVAENWAFGLKLRKYGPAEIAQRVQAAAERLGLAEILDRPPATLSGGSASVSRSDARWSATRGYFFWTNRFRTSTRSCFCRCGWRSRGSSFRWRSR